MLSFADGDFLITMNGLICSIVDTLSMLFMDSMNKGVNGEMNCYNLSKHRRVVSYNLNNI